MELINGDASTEAAITAEAIETAATKYLELLQGGKLKGTVLGEIARLLQVRNDPDAERNVAIRIGWIEQWEPSEADDER
jgi:hypothetical protein